MVRSEENLPERATLSTDMRLQRGCRRKPSRFGLCGGVGVEVGEHEEAVGVEQIIDQRGQSLAVSIAEAAVAKAVHTSRSRGCARSSCAGCNRCV